jgi:hypothetical protein
VAQKKFVFIIISFLLLNSAMLTVLKAENKSLDSFEINQNLEKKSTETKTSSGETRSYKDYQDSLYQRFLKLNVTARTLFNFNLSLSDEAWSNILNNTSELPYQAALRSLNTVPSIAFIPTGVEKMLYQSNLEAARYIPGIITPNYGLKVSMNDIGVFMGIIEDTSPEIFYSLDAPNDVEVVIYSIQAKVIATLFDGRQIPGKFKLTWNFRDDNGRRMMSGDYIAEVRIGNSKFVRKRIVIP